jgi:hypothetical protein
MAKNKSNLEAFASWAGKLNARLRTSRHENNPKPAPDESGGDHERSDARAQSSFSPASQQPIAAQNAESGHAHTYDDKNDPDESFKRTQLRHSRRTLIATWVIAVATIAYMFFAYLQWREIHTQVDLIRESSSQTQQMIATTQNMASATQNSANAMRDVAVESGKTANAATNQAIAAGEQVGISQNQANTSAAQANSMKQLAAATGSSARAAERSAQVAAQSFALSEQPNIAISGAQMQNMVVGKKLTFKYFIENDGSTPLHGIKSQARPYIGHSPPPASLRTWYENLTADDIGSLIPAQGKKTADTTFDWVLTEEQFNAIKEGSINFYMVGEIHYLDGLGRRWQYRFCGRYVLAENTFLSCGESNAPQPSNYQQEL